MYKDFSMGMLSSPKMATVESLNNVQDMSTKTDIINDFEYWMIFNLISFKYLKLMEKYVDLYVAWNVEIMK